MTTYLLAASKNYLASYTGLSTLCWQGMMLSFVESTLIGVYYFLPLYFINDLHWQIALAGFAISFYGMGTIIGGFLGGKLSDSWSPGIVCVTSLIAQAFVFLGLLFLQSFASLIVVLFFMGVSSYAFITSNHLWVLAECENDESKKLKAINILSAASNLGLGLSAVIISVLSDYGFSYIFSLSMTLLGLSAIYFFYLERKRLGNKVSVKTLVKQEEIIAPTKSNKKIVWIVLSCVFLVGLIIFQLNTTYSLYIQKAFPHLGIKAVSILFGINSFLVVLFQVPIVHWVKHKNKMWIVGAGALLLGFGMFMLIFSVVFAMAICATFIYTAGEMLFFSVAQFICYENGGEKKGSTLGAFRTIYASSRVIAPAAGTLVYQHLGGNVLWLICGFIGCSCFLLCNYNKKYG